jgi:tRNA/tmRNA/rRNA uracil-C5-methylase (TrmA/RlmC/RlmD family)
VGGRPVADALTVLGLDDSDGLHWRTRMRYAVSNTGTVGLRAARSHRIIPAANCPLAVTELSEEIPVSLPEPDTNRAPRALIAAHSNTGQTKQTVNERDRELLIERVGDRDFEVALTGFWQVHPQAPQVLVDAVLAAANVQPGDRVLDLYSGVGLFAAFLGIEAGVTGRVDAVEGDKTAVALAKRNLADLAWVHHHRSAVDSWITHSQREADVIVLDPPRSGAGKDVVEGIVRTAPRVVVYVACDPVALARDVKTFSQRGYALTYVRGLDLFPMTKHVETIAVFKPTPQ